MTVNEQEPVLAWAESPMFAREGMSTIPAPAAGMRPMVFVDEPEIVTLLRKAGLTKVTK